MRTTLGDMWEIPATAKVVPTNGVVTAERLAVMGAGVAKQAAMKMPVLPPLLGGRISRFGNRVFAFRLTPEEGQRVNAVYIITFPTKHDWKNDSSLDLIEKSAWQLAELSKSMGFGTIVMPEVGMGLGNLHPKLVYPILERHLDDRFTVVKYAKEKGM